MNVSPPIKISPQTAEVAPHPDNRSHVVPRHFRALFLAVPGKDWPISAELEITVGDDGEAACIAAQIWVGPPEDPEDPAPDLTADLMRLPVSRLKKAALDAAAVEVMPERFKRGYVAEKVRMPKKSRGLRRKRSRITEEDLEGVAAIYREAKARHLAVKEQVGYEMGVAESSAARLIRKARERGFIKEPPRPGRPRKGKKS